MEARSGLLGGRVAWWILSSLPHLHDIRAGAHKQFPQLAPRTVLEAWRVLLGKLWEVWRASLVCACLQGYCKGTFMSQGGCLPCTLQRARERGVLMAQRPALLAITRWCIPSKPRYHQGDG